METQEPQKSPGIAKEKARLLPCALGDRRGAGGGGGERGGGGGGGGERPCSGWPQRAAEIFTKVSAGLTYSLSIRSGKWRPGGDL